VPREITGDRGLDRIQQNAASSGAASRALPYGDGLVILQGQVLANSMVLAHKLGRRFVGVELKNFVGAFPGWVVDRTASNQDKFVKLTTIALAGAYGSATCDVWVW
jgi:hypothetical protein